MRDMIIIRLRSDTAGSHLDTAPTPGHNTDTAGCNAVTARSAIPSH